MFVSEPHLPQVQAGIESPRHPGSGLISRREVRIVHFQRWLLDHLESQGFVTDSLHQAPDVFARHWLIYARRSGPSYPASQECHS
jgi:hypothetical protein